MRRNALLLVAALAFGLAAWAVWPRGGDAPPRPPDLPRETDAPPSPPPRLAPAPGSTPPSPTTPGDGGPSPEGGPGEANATATARLRVHVRGLPVDGRPTGVRAHVRDATGRETTREPGADGDAVFADLPPGTVRVWVDAPGHVGTEPEEIGLVGGRETETTHGLRPGARVTGRVVAARTGTPVAGASVDAEDGGAIEGMSSTGGRASYGPVVTDADGRFETAVLPFGEIVTVTARAKGFRSAGASLRLRATDGSRPPLEVRLEPGGTVRGRVLDADGQPAPAAEVSVCPEAWDDVREHPHVSFAGSETGKRAATHVRSDAEGRFEVEGLPLDVPLCAMALHRAFARAADACGLVLSERSPEADVTLRLRRPASVTVTLRDPEDRPIVHGEIQVGEGFGTTRGRLDGDGKAHVTGLAPGSNVLEVVVDGFVPVREEFVLDEGQTLERRLRLSRGLSVAGTVLDESGAPVRDASVQASREGARRSPVARTRTGADGAFRLEGLEPGTHVLRAYAGDVDVRPSPPLSPPATDVRLVAQRFARVRARLVAPPGATPSEVMLGAYDEAGGSASGGPFGDGHVTWTLARGTWRLTVRASGFATLERRVTVTTSEGLDLGDLPLDVGATIEGVVVAPDGAGLPGVTLEAQDPDEAGARTGEDGRFRLEHLRRGRVVVDATAPGFCPGEIVLDLATPPAPVRLVLARGALVTGRLQAAGGGRLPEGLHWRATRLGDPSGDAIAGHEYVGDGDTFASRLPAGRYALELLVDETVLWRQDLALEEGRDVALGIPVPAR